MSAVDHCEDPEPSERIPAGLLFVPVRSGPMGCTARFFRTPLGDRTAVGFTSADRLTAALGSDQSSIRLSEPALRALAAPLGVTALTVDPVLSAPAAVGSPAVDREHEHSWRGWTPQHVGVLRVTGAAALVACLNLLIGRGSLTEAADPFGSPLYVLDEEEVRERSRAYRTAFPDADLVFAAEVFLCRAIVHWVQEEGLGLDVCSDGELELAVTTGFPPEKIVMRGNAKSPEDLRTVLRLGVGRIVVDSASEIARLAAFTPAGAWRKAAPAPA